MTNEADRDPKLASLAAKIQTILEQEGVAGTVALASPTHGEYVSFLPAWCGVQPILGPNGELGIRVKVKSSDSEHVNASAHAVLSLRDQSMMMAANWIKMADVMMDVLKKHGVEVEHEPFGGNPPAYTFR